MNVQDLKVGDKIFVLVGMGHTSYIPAEVVRVTPSGYRDVLLSGHGKPIRFQKTGDQLGGSRLYGYSLDVVSYEERTARLLEDKKKIRCAVLLNKVRELDMARSTWGKEGLQRMSDEMQQLLDAAKTEIAGLL